MTTLTAATETEPGVKRAIGAFHKGLLRRHGIRSDPRHWGRFGREVKLLIQAWGEDDVLALIDDFFASRDPYILRSQYTQIDFLNNIQRLRLPRAADLTTIENLDAAARAMQPIRGRE